MSDSRVISYVESVAQKAVGVDVNIEKPVLKTGFSPVLAFSADKINLTKDKKELLNIDNLAAEVSFAEILKKNIIINHVKLGYFYADVSEILSLPVMNQEQKNEQKNDWKIDVFESILAVDKALILYNVDKDTKIVLNADNLQIDGDVLKKHVRYNVKADILKGQNKLTISTSDGGHVYLENKEKFVAKDCKVLINQSNIIFGGFIDKNANYDFGISSDKFSIPAVLDLLDSQIVPNNISEILVYFKDIDGDFNFNFNISNKDLRGDINLLKAGFKVVPVADLPVLLTDGKVTLDSQKVVLKGFKGYYDGKPYNKMDFEGTVGDYLKSIDTNLKGNAVVTNDFSSKYLSKMAGYPIHIEGKADTKITLKSKYNKIDLDWLFIFKKGNGFVFDGNESTMNDLANRAMYAKMHFENMLLNLEQLSYYAGNPEHKRKDSRIPILSMNGNFDFSNGDMAIRDVGFELPKPMPSGFINLLMKQKIFRNGTFTGSMQIINTGRYPVLSGNMKAENVAIPSQRLFIKNGEFKVENNLMHITSDGRYRRSVYDLKGAIVNQLKFPIVVKNITLSVDNIDVLRYLKLFNAQQAVAPTDLNTELLKTVDTGQDVDSDDESDDAQAFDLSNLIVEECILKVAKGAYKQINFANVAAKLTLDKNNMLKIQSNKFDIAEGTSSAKIDCDLKNHKYSIRLGIKEVNSDIIATSLLNLSKEIDGRASGLIELNTDDSLKLNGRIRFKVYKGIIGKVGLVEYIMKVAALFRNPLTMVSPSTISDLVNVPEGRFDQIDGDLILKDNVVMPMKIKSSAPQLSSYIVGTYNLENQDASLRIYTKFSNRKKGLYGMFRNLSLNSLSNRIPLSSRNDSNYYEAEISQIPDIDADEKDCQIFLTKVDGDVEHNNFLSSLKKIK